VAHESSAKYLGSVLHSDGKDDADVTARVKKATGAFACLFKRKDVTNEANNWGLHQLGGSTGDFSACGGHVFIFDK
jgi:hypothetical protein